MIVWCLPIYLITSYMYYLFRQADNKMGVTCIAIQSNFRVSSSGGSSGSGGGSKRNAEKDDDKESKGMHEYINHLMI